MSLLHQELELGWEHQQLKFLEKSYFDDVHFASNVPSFQHNALFISSTVHKNNYNVCNDLSTVLNIITLLYDQYQPEIFLH